MKDLDIKRKGINKSIKTNPIYLLWPANTTVLVDDRI